MTRPGTFLALVLAALPLAAAAAPPRWANAAEITATDATCGAVRSLTLTAGPPPRPAGMTGCAIREETLDAVFVSGRFLPRGDKGPIDEADVEARRVACAKGGAMILLGTPADSDRALREHPPRAGCTVSRVRYQRLSINGGIPFVEVVAPKAMSVAESLAMHARERERMIAECNASPSCRADRARASNGAGRKSYTCPPGYYHGGSPDNPYASCYPIR